SGGAANSPQNVTVTLVVGTAGTASLKVSRTRLSFSKGEEDSSLRGTIRVTSSGAPIAFTASPSGGNWLSVSSTGGTTPATLTVSVNIAGLAPGQYSGVIALSAPGASNATSSVAVTFSMSRGDDSSDHGDG